MNGPGLLRGLLGGCGLRLTGKRCPAGNGLAWLCECRLQLPGQFCATAAATGVARQGLHRGQIHSADGVAPPAEQLLVSACHGVLVAAGGLGQEVAASFQRGFYLVEQVLAWAQRLSAGLHAGLQILLLLPAGCRGLCLLRKRVAGLLQLCNILPELFQRRRSGGGRLGLHTVGLI